MKLLRIGSASSCDIVIKSEYVSALHAEMTLLDDGKIIIEDKNSTNGTFVGNVQLEPGQEETVQRGDRIVFADTPLVWAKVPVPESLAAYKQVLNVGSNYRNEIIVNSQTVSRYHASIRVDKKNKVYVHDNGSRNGTMVNGIKIAPNKDVQIKKGDSIICGAEEISGQIQSVFPSSGIGKIAAIAGAVLGVAAAVALIIWLWPNAPTEEAKKMRDATPTQIRTAVVYVQAVFHYTVTFDDNPMPGVWNGVIDNIAPARQYSGTAFFLDREGRMGTNRHIAVPWEYRDSEDEEYIRSEVEKQLKLAKAYWYYRLGDSTMLSSLIGQKIVTDADFSKFETMPFANALSAYIVKQDNPGQALLDILDRLAKTPYKISGASDYLMVAYPGKNYTHLDELQRCSVLCESGNPDIDAAILQLNQKLTPPDVAVVFDPHDICTDRLEPLADKLYVSGYPAGLLLNLDEKTQSLEPSIRETKCSREPSRYFFEFQDSSLGGSSGSPVYNEKHQLVGILYGGWVVNGEKVNASQAVLAKYLLNLYEEAVGL